MATTFVISGDPTKDALVNAILVPINRVGVWQSELDMRIVQVAGSFYHVVPARIMNTGGLDVNQTIIVKGDHTQHDGSFDNVLFFVISSTSALHVSILAALKASADEGYQSVTLTLAQDVDMPEMIKAVQLFSQEPKGSKMILYVFVSDWEKVSTFNTELARLQ